MEPSGFDGRDMLTIVYFAVLAAISVATGFLIRWIIEGHENDFVKGGRWQATRHAAVRGSAPATCNAPRCPTGAWSSPNSVFALVVHVSAFAAWTAADLRQLSARNGRIVAGRDGFRVRLN